MSEPAIDPFAAYARVSGWTSSIDEGFSAVGKAWSPISELSLGADGFSQSAISFVNGVRGVRDAVRAVAQAATDADLGGMSSYELIQASIDAGLEKSKAEADAEAIAQAEEYAKLFPDPDEGADPPEAAKVAEIADFLEENRDNEAVMTAFYGAVPAENLLAFVQDLGKMDNNKPEVKKAQSEFMVQIGETLGDASSNGWLPAGYDDDLVKAVDSGFAYNMYGRDVPGWALAQVLQNGQYSTEFLGTVGEGMLAYERRYEANSSLSVWTAWHVPPLGYGGVDLVNPVDAAMQAMIRNPDPAALESFLYPHNANPEERHQYLANRSLKQADEISDWPTLAQGFERLAIPGPDADPYQLRLADTAASDAIAVLPPSMENGAHPAARQSLANIMAYYWSDVDFLLRQDKGDYQAGGSEGYDDYMGLPDSGRDFTRDEALAALAVTMDLNDFPSDGTVPADTPSATIVAASTDFNAYRNQRALSREPYSESEVTSAYLDAQTAVNSIAEFGFGDEVVDAEKRDAAMAGYRAFGIALATVAATAAATAAIPAGPAASAAAGTGAAWGAEVLLDEVLPVANSAENTKNQSDAVAENLKTNAKLSWVLSVLESAEYYDDGTLRLGGPDGHIIDTSSLPFVDEKGNVDMSQIDGLLDSKVNEQLTQDQRDQLLREQQNTSLLIDKVSQDLEPLLD